jgi:hypothetical protein
VRDALSWPHASCNQTWSDERPLQIANGAPAAEHAGLHNVTTNGAQHQPLVVAGHVNDAVSCRLRAPPHGASQSSHLGSFRISNFCPAANCFGMRQCLAPPPQRKLREVSWK